MHMHICHMHMHILICTANNPCIPLPTVKLAIGGFVFGFMPILLHIRRIGSILVCQIRRFSCWMSSDDLEKHSTTFSSRSARFQLENTHLVVENEIFKNLEIFEKILRKSILIKFFSDCRITEWTFSQNFRKLSKIEINVFYSLGTQLWQTSVHNK